MKIGDVVDGKYELVRILGEGGMGRVFEGRNVRIGRKVALKFLHPELAKNAEVVIRFMREAQAAAAIGSEHIVEVFDVGDTSEGAPYLVMEYLVGEDLHAIVEREGPLAVERAATLVSQACQGLAAAHRLRIIHRDLKPENLFVIRREDGQEWVKIVDFGIAKFRDSLGDAQPRLTNQGTAIGTPYYMSPEQAMAVEDLDNRTDLYSLGVILYEVLTGHPPFTGRSYNELLVMITTSDPKPPRDLRPDLPEALQKLVLRAMARDRNARHRSADDLREALRPFCGEILARQSSAQAPAGMGTKSDPDSAQDLVETQLGPPALAFGNQGREDPTPKALIKEDGPSTGTPMAWQSGQGVPSDGNTGRSKRPWKKYLFPLFSILMVGSIAAALVFTFTNQDETPVRSTATSGRGEQEKLSREGTTPQSGVGAEAAAEPIVDKEPPARFDTVRLEVNVEPRDAELRIDSVRVDRLPFVGRFPRDGVQHRVEASAKGFKAHSQFVSLDEDKVIDVRLEPMTENKISEPRRERVTSGSPAGTVVDTPPVHQNASLEQTGTPTNVDGSRSGQASSLEAIVPAEPTKETPSLARPGKHTIFTEFPDR